MNGAQESSSGKLLVAVAALVGAMAVGGAAYALFVEPYWIELTRHSLTGNIAQPLKIAHVTDLHTHGFGSREQRLVALIEAERPDLIVVTGDTVDDGQLNASREIFQRLRAPLGVFVVRGNWDSAISTHDEKTFYASVNVRLLVDAGLAIRPDLWLFGLDDPGTGRPDIRAALEGAPPAAYKIGLFHSPDHFKDVAGLFHLALAGHSHGGQIRLPQIGPLMLPEHGRQFVAGWYTSNRSRLYVSRGIGTTGIPARFLCRPELAIVELRPQGP